MAKKQSNKKTAKKTTTKKAPKPNSNYRSDEIQTLQAVRAAISALDQLINYSAHFVYRKGNEHLGTGELGLVRELIPVSQVEWLQSRGVPPHRWPVVARKAIPEHKRVKRDLAKAEADYERNRLEEKTTDANTARWVQLYKEGHAALNTRFRCHTMLGLCTHADLVQMQKHTEDSEASTLNVVRALEQELAERQGRSQKKA